MPALSDYTSGTITLTNGLNTFTGTGTGWEAADFREGDTILGIEDHAGVEYVIATIDGNGSGTLTQDWEGATGTYTYRMRYMADGARVTAKAAQLVELLGNGNLQALAGLTGPGVPVFNGPHSMIVKPETDFINGVAYDIQVDTLADRAAYDGQSEGFTVLVSDVGDGRSALYSKNSNTVGDWSDPAYITGPSVDITVGPVTELPYGTAPTITPISGTGTLELDFGLPGGPSLSVGTVARGDVDVTSSPVAGGYELDFTIPAMEAQGDYAGATAYVPGDVAQYQGSSWVATQNTTGNAPPVLPVTSNAFWQLLARAGNDGTGTVTSIVAGEGITVDNTDPENPIISGAVTDVTVVADRTELKALDTSGVSVAILTEPGREGQFIWRAGDYSALVTADTLEGIYIEADGVAATDGAWVRQYDDLADVRWFGAALDDTTDDTAAFNVALAVAKHVFFPEGRAYVTDMIQVPTNGSLTGLNVELSVFSLKADFNMGAQGIVKMGTAEGTQKIDKIGFEFFQPSVGARVDMVHYPWAIYHNNLPRVRIGHVRFTRAWNGIHAGLNAGGATYDWIECGTMNRGIFIDGALDTINLGRFRVWPFGMVPNVGPGAVYRDGSNIGLEIGRCDGLAGEVHMFRAIAYFGPNGGGSASRHLTSLHLDGDYADLRVESGPLDIDFLYSTKSETPTTQAILLGGDASANVRISNLYLVTSASTQPPILVNAGSLSINGGKIDSRAAGKEAAIVQGGTLSLKNVELTALGARSTRYILANNSAATLIVSNCNFPANGGTGTAIEMVASAAGSRISGNSYGGRSLSIAGVVALGGIDRRFQGYVSADATVSRLPPGWSASKISVGNYSITHNLNLTQSRQFISAMVQNTATTGDVVVDQTNTTTNTLRLRTFSAGTATDLPFTFELAHI